MRNIFARVWPPAAPKVETARKVRPSKPRLQKITYKGESLKVLKSDFNMVIVELYKANTKHTIVECKEVAVALFVSGRIPRSWAAPDKSIKRLCRTYREAAKMAVAPQLENVP